ncbi:MAG: magnetosome protein MamC [Bacteriovoracaceae bacterium]|nr:magnetosome protein MamC [Bacteriovoracaceae bacterium]
MAFNLAVFLAESAFGVGVLGGVVGGSAAVAKNTKLHQKGEIKTEEAIRDSAEEALGAGVATAFSAVTAGAVGGGLMVSLVTAFAAAACGKYAWDRGVEAVHKRLKIEGSTVYPL